MPLPCSAAVTAACLACQRTWRSWRPSGEASWLRARWIWRAMAANWSGRSSVSSPKVVGYASSEVSLASSPRTMADASSSASLVGKYRYTVATPTPARLATAGHRDRGRVGLGHEVGHRPHDALAGRPLVGVAQGLGGGLVIVR